MKKLGLVAAVAAMAMTGTAFAGMNNMYVGAHLGASVVPDTKANYTPTGGSATEVKLENKTGLNAAVALGMAQGPMRYEVEYLYAQSKSDKLTIGGTAQPGVKGKTKLNAGMLNAYYDFAQAKSAVVPYVGLGIGYAKVDHGTDITGTADVLHDSDNVFAFQGKLGVAYNIDSAMAVTADYTYFRTADADFKIKDGSSNYTMSENFETHNFRVGLKWNF